MDISNFTTISKELAKVIIKTKKKNNFLHNEELYFAVLGYIQFGEISETFKDNDCYRLIIDLIEVDKARLRTLRANASKGGRKSHNKSLQSTSSHEAIQIPETNSREASLPVPHKREAISEARSEDSSKVPSNPSSTLPSNPSSTLPSNPSSTLSSEVTSELKREVASKVSSTLPSVLLSNPSSTLPSTLPSVLPSKLVSEFPSNPSSTLTSKHKTQDINTQSQEESQSVVSTNSRGKCLNNNIYNNLKCVFMCVNTYLNISRDLNIQRNINIHTFLNINFLQDNILTQDFKPPGYSGYKCSWDERTIYRI